MKVKIDAARKAQNKIFMGVLFSKKFWLFLQKHFGLIYLLFAFFSNNDLCEGGIVKSIVPKFLWSTSLDIFLVFA